MSRLRSDVELLLISEGEPDPNYRTQVSFSNHVSFTEYVRTLAKPVTSSRTLDSSLHPCLSITSSLHFFLPSREGDVGISLTSFFAGLLRCLLSYEVAKMDTTGGFLTFIARGNPESKVSSREQLDG